MKCPVCKKKLTRDHIQYFEIHSCPGNHGMWISSKNLSGLLQKMVLMETTPPADLKKIYNVDYKRPVNEKRKCPQCRAPMSTFNYAYNSNIFLDRCSPCDSVWIDAEEFMQLASYAKGNPRIDRLGKGVLEYYSGNDDLTRYKNNPNLIFGDFIKVSLEEITDERNPLFVKIVWLVLAIIVVGIVLLYHYVRINSHM